MFLDKWTCWRGVEWGGGGCLTSIYQQIALCTIVNWIKVEFLDKPFPSPTYAALSSAITFVGRPSRTQSREPMKTWQPVWIWCDWPQTWNDIARSCHDFVKLEGTYALKRISIFVDSVLRVLRLFLVWLFFYNFCDSVGYCPVCQTCMTFKGYALSGR